MPDFNSKEPLDATSSQSTAPQGWESMLEVGLIVFLYFLYAGAAAPGINESHYLTRMKHFWNPAWCHGDLFLDSGESQPVFHLTLGWLSMFLSLPMLAWALRLIAWIGLATAWLRLSRRVAPAFGWGVFSAGMTLLLWDRAHMAGEWVVGGMESKVPAYVLVFLGLASLHANHWGKSLILLGAATAFHPLVGGWSLLCLGFAWLTDKQRPKLSLIFGPLVIAFAISLFGVIPALRLDQGAGPEMIRNARYAYVMLRLRHHLLFYELPWTYGARHLAMIVAWLLVWRISRPSRGVSRIQWFVLGCVLLAVVGLVIETITLPNWIFRSAWMRYYWYRMTDSMVPVGCAILLTDWMWRMRTMPALAPRMVSRARLGMAAIVLLVAASLGLNIRARQADARPPADQQGRSFGFTSSAWRAELQDWKSMCAWCGEHTPSDALFLTPIYASTFKWYAHRPEFVTWKDIPQDSRSLAEWAARRRQVRHLGVYFSQGKPQHDVLKKWLAENRIAYLVAARNYGDATWQFPIRYENNSYRVYRIGE